MKLVHVLSMLLVSTVCCVMLDDDLIDCEMEEGHTFVECNNSTGTENIQNRSLIPHNTQCLQKVDTNIVPVRCQNGVVIYSVSEGMLETHLMRVKRKAGESLVAAGGALLVESGAAIGFAVGGPVGAAIGAVTGAVVGLIGSIICFFVCPDEQKFPPQIQKSATLEGRTPIYAEKGRIDAVVKWTKTVFKEKDVTVTLDSPYQSGQRFEEGSYLIIYRGSKDGLSTVDYLQFQVKVHTCNPPEWPENGDLKCSRNDFIYGTSCTVNCKGGYVLESSNSELTCNVRSWSQLKVPDCKPRTCDPVPAIPNGNVECRDNKAIYDNVCEAVCTMGYRVQGARLMGCDQDGKWGGAPTCLDITAPQFKNGECSSDIQVYIDATNNTAKVTWEIPHGVDNSGNKPIITETHGYIPRQRFEAGSHTVKYTIKDQAGNRGDSCMFTIQVLTISCSPPKLNVTGGEHLHYDCPDAYMLGATCNLACMSGYPMGGVNVIQCLRHPDVYPPKLDWTWRNGSLAPFCKETNCSMAVLHKPEHGALACSGWTHGQMCQMQCENGYDIPNVGDGMFVCGRSTGKWRPSADVPDCNIRMDANHMHLPNKFYYYTGKCNSSEQNLLHIQENFVKALNASKFIEACFGVPECQAKFVDVICGPVSSRRRRSIHGGNRYRRSVERNAYTLHFDLVLPIKREAGKSLNDIVTTNEDMFDKMSDAIQKEVDSHHFDLHIDDLQVDSNSYDIGSPRMACPEGTIPKTETGTCVGCPVGQYSDGGRCVDCPIGKYQNSTNSITCTPCPLGTNTTETGAKYIQQCKGYCLEGEYSATGLSPCTKCASNSYQNESKSTNCQLCGKDTRSRTNGATSRSQCLAFDIEVSETSVVEMKNTHEREIMTVYMWVYVRNSTNTKSSFQILNTEGDLSVGLLFTSRSKVMYNGSEYNLNGSIPISTWTNIVIIVHKLTDRLQVYISGQLSFDLALDVSKLYTKGLQDILKVHGGCTISGFKVLPRAPTLSEISTWSSTCTPSITNVTLTMDDLANNENSRIKLPAMCDPVNACDSSPCGNHTCTAKLGDYACRCLNGYSGRQCQTPPDFCKDNDCKNEATCVRGSSNYTCDCQFGFSGKICGTKAADGQWSDWTKWSSCSKSCSGGNQTRYRRCDSPPADTEGKPCHGNNSETVSCNEEACPECLTLRKTDGLRITCNETTDMQRCSISCRPDLQISDVPLPYYECGRMTSYKWNHQTEENPTARLPSCTEIEPPQNLGVSFNSEYDSIPCTADGIAKAKQALEEKLSTIDCANAGLCEATVHEPVCNDVGDTLKMTVELHSAVDATKESLNIASTLQNKSEPSSALINFVNLTLELEKSAQDIFNSSEDFFELTIDGEDHPMVPGTGLTFDKEIGCPSGTVPITIVCAECPAGSRCDGKTVTMCPRGQFQDEPRQSVCKMCPLGKTTEGVGSIYLSECTVVVDSGEQHTESQDIDNGVKIAVGTCSSIAFLVLSAVGLFFLKKHLQKGRSKVHDSNPDLYSNSQMYTPTKPVFNHMQLVRNDG